MLEMTSLNSQIYLAPGGQIVKNWSSCQEIAFFCAPVELYKCIFCVCVCARVRARQLSNVCGRACLMKYLLF
jgi:hypothetical protein